MTNTITKLHFNGVDYNVGAANVHELTEKTNLVGNDEFLVADSENIYQNKRVNLYNLGESLTINCLSEVLIVGEKYTNTDKLIMQQEALADNSIAGYNVGDISTNRQIHIQKIASGTPSNTILLKIRKTGNPGNLHCDIYNGTIYNVSLTEDARYGTGTAIATSTINSGDITSSRQTITITLNTSVGGTRGDLLDVVLYQGNNDVDASNYYEIACDTTQWSEAFRFVSVDGDTIVQNYLMPYCSSNAFKKSLVCKYDETVKQLSAKIDYSYQYGTAGVFVGWPLGATKPINDLQIENNSASSIQITYSIVCKGGYAVSNGLYEQNSGAYNQLRSWNSGTQTISGTSTVLSNGSRYLYFERTNGAASDYNSQFSTYNVSYTLTSGNFNKGYIISGYTKNNIVYNIGELSKFVFLGKYNENKYVMGIE